MILSNPEIMSPFFELRTPLVKDDVSQIFSLIDNVYYDSLYMDVKKRMMILMRYILTLIIHFIITTRIAISNLSQTLTYLFLDSIMMLLFQKT